MATIKPLILLEWIHLFASGSGNPRRKAFRWTCFTLGAVIVRTYTISIWMEATACRPREYWWDRSIPGGHCVDTRHLPIATGTINAVVDLFILLLPQGVV
ncbi:Satratoxin biosynthesis SC1 cluster protein 4 [Apiospora saccharicola]